MDSDPKMTEDVKNACDVCEKTCKEMMHFLGDWCVEYKRKHGNEKDVKEITDLETTEEMRLKAYEQMKKEFEHQETQLKNPLQEDEITESIEVEMPKIYITLNLLSRLIDDHIHSSTENETDIIYHFKRRVENNETHALMICKSLSFEWVHWELKSNGVIDDVQFIILRDTYILIGEVKKRYNHLQELLHQASSVK